jgi:hypothetical protein
MVTVVSPNALNLKGMKAYIKLTTLAVLLMNTFTFKSHAQLQDKKFKDGLKIYLSDDSIKYIKATGLAQIWMRYNDNNPGSTIYGTPKNETFDVGLRRVRYQIMSQVSKKVFFYTQIGINSVNSLSARKTGIFFHDVTGEYSVYKNYFTIGTGLSGWNGTARFSSSGVATILGMDLPVVQETTNDISDQFVRKLGIYAKGKIIGFDYRLSVSNPFPVQNAITAVASLPATENNVAYFSTNAPKLHYQGYVMWQFFDKESNQLPYMAGSYLGKKRVLNIGAGFAFEKDAMWYRNSNQDTVLTPLQQFGIDVFFDSYLDKNKQNAITAYISFLNYDFGPNYIRNAGAMNTANGVNGNASFNGPGNAFPLIGTGQVVFGQIGYLFRKDLLKSYGTLQPYFSILYANYEKLKDPVLVYDLGLNWIMGESNSKISLDYQSRPIFNSDLNGNISDSKSERRGQLVLQYQLAF